MKPEEAVRDRWWVAQPSLWIAHGESLRFSAEVGSDGLIFEAPPEEAARPWYSTKSRWQMPEQGLSPCSSHEGLARCRQGFWTAALLGMGEDVETGASLPARIVRLRSSSLPACAWSSQNRRPAGRLRRLSR